MVASTVAVDYTDGQGQMRAQQPLPEPPCEVDEGSIRRERAKARELRRSQWWKRRCADGVCHYCGARVGPHELTMDHLVPLARGGRSTKGNLVPACKDCNSKKKHRLAFEWEAG